MSSFLPGLNWLSSETERHERESSRNAPDEPTPMDVEGEGCSQFRCSSCNGNLITFLLTSRSQPAIDEFDTKGIVPTSHPDTSPIYFYDHDKPFFECARALHPDDRRKRNRTYVLRSDSQTSLCTRLSMMKRSTLPPSTVRSGAIPCSCDDDPLCSLSSIQVHDH